MNKLKIAGAAGIFLLLFVTGILIFVLPDRAFSDNENRTLSQKPALSVEALEDGSLQKGLDSYLSDQFPGRDLWMGLGTQIKLLTGRKDIGDTYIGKDHYYFEKVLNSDIDQNRYCKNLEKIDTVAEKFPDVPFSVMLIPSSGIILSEKLPAQAKLYDAAQMIQTEKQVLKNCSVIDAAPELQAHSGESLYYRTDHHWTTLGAEIGYRALMGERAAYSDALPEPVTNSFLGTLYSRTLDTGRIPDSIILPKVSDRVKVQINGKEAAMYDDSALAKKDQYQVFFGGNFGRIDITGGSGTGTLLVIKDSFANCMVPFLTADYERIIMVDLRYSAQPVSEILEQEHIDNVLILYEMNNFANDQNVSKILM